MIRKLPIVVTAVVALAATANAFSSNNAGFVDGVWVNGVVHDLSTGPTPPGAKHPIDLYVIAPISAAHPLHPLAFAKPLGFGAHDHVAAIPGSKPSFRGVCDVTLVVPGAKARLGANVAARQTLTPAASKPLLYQARLGAAMVPLNRVSRIEHAEALGLAKLINTHTVIACTITARR